jgi:2-polyprenyl-6-methoxyphenol hydroxylase-like FAD-dependent oxidoreductase
MATKLYRERNPMPSPPSEISVLIVGAGPTGLTLACDLARRQVDFRLIDKAPAYFVGSRGKGLQPRSLEVFDDLGIVDRLLSVGRFHLPFRAYDGTTILGDRDLHEGHHPTPAVPYASPLIVPQWRVEEALRQLLSTHGKQVELATELVGIEQDEKGVTATLRTESGQATVRCQYLVAADGGRSFVRKFLRFGFAGETWQDARLYVGDVRVEGLDRDHWHSWSQHPDGWLALCPLPSTDAFQLQAGIPPGFDESPSLENFQRIVNERTGRSDLKLYDPTWLSLYRVNIRMVDQYRKGRVFLAGDAAHVHPPTGGQGMNTGIQDAYNLGWKLGLVLRGAPASLLDTYEEERLPVAASVLGLSTRLSLEFRERGNQLSRDPDTLQLGIQYRQSSLSLQQSGSPLSLQPGDRAPDAPLLDAKSNRVRLFDLLRGPHFTLLILGATNGAGRDWFGERYREQVRLYAIGPEAMSPERWGAGQSSWLFREQGGHLSQTYGVNNRALVLIRPDGYIGWSGDDHSLFSAERYLDRILGTVNGG